MTVSGRKAAALPALVRLPPGFACRHASLTVHSPHPPLHPYAATLQAFSKVIGSKAAGLTLGPLIAWTSYATALNYTLLAMNPEKTDKAAPSGTSSSGSDAKEQVAKTVKEAKSS